jgi:hypothetical protein
MGTATGTLEEAWMHTSLGTLCRAGTLQRLLGQR